MSNEYDPISIAALVAALPELNTAYAKAKAVSDKALQDLNDMQNRIEGAIEKLREVSPPGSFWHNKWIQNGIYNPTLSPNYGPPPNYGIAQLAAKYTK